jgi:putative transposase
MHVADKGGVSIPREVLPGRSYMITRRCTQRQFLMRPDAETNNAFIYCLAVAAQGSGIEVLFTIATSNHHHTGIYDPTGNYPQFIEHFHKMFAKCQNALRGRRENFWSSEQTSVVLLVDPNDVIAKLTYAVSNPVKDQLVEKAHHWPGVSSLLGRDLTAKRPRRFFRHGGEMPETATLKFERPQGWKHLSSAEYSALVTENVERVEKAAADHRRQTGGRVLGRTAILLQDWRACPVSPSPRHELNPRIAAQSKWARIEAVLRNRAFRDAYIAARERFLEGVRDVVFPAGTYWLRKFAQVACATAPPAPV